MDSREVYRAVAAELRRLGLANCPSGMAAVSLDGMYELLLRLRSLSAGATWDDVFPSPAPARPDAPEPVRPPAPPPLVRPFAPAHARTHGSTPGRYPAPEATPGYHPLGRWDHPAAPAEPVFHLINRNGDDDWLTDLLIAAATEGVPLHGAGTVEQGSGVELGHEHGFVVVRRGLASDELEATVEWLRHQPDITVASRRR